MTERHIYPDITDEEIDELDDDQICAACSGCGEGRYDGERCSVCKGTGIEPMDMDDDY